MRYSTELGDRIYVKGYGILSFVKKLSKSLSKKPSSLYEQKLLDITSNILKIASNSDIQ